MRLLRPDLLYSLGFVPLILFLYLWGIRRRKPFGLRMSSLSILRAAAREQSRWRRHFPFFFFLTALVSLLIAMCRPVIPIQTSSKQGIIILTLDVSRSMCSTDIQPTRLQALESTVLRFIAAQRPGTQIGIVAFSDFAELIQTPTGDKIALSQAVQSLMTGSGTAIGKGIYESLDVAAGAESNGSSAKPGLAPAAIILVTDGVNNAGPSPLDAARLAAERGVRIYTVGLSSPSGPFDVSCQSSDPSEFGENSQSGTAGASSNPDVKMLKQIAAMTGAEYFPASGLTGLKHVFQDAQLREISILQDYEVTFAFAGLGAFFAMTSLFAALFWSPAY